MYMSDELAKTQEATVYVCNLSEDVWSFIQAMSDAKIRKNEIAENAALSDRDLFSLSGTDHLIFISPLPLGESFLSYFKELTGAKDVQIWVTQKHSGELCRDILSDTQLLEKLKIAANSVKRLTLISYAMTFQFLALVNKLREEGISVITPEAPEEEDAWTVNFYGSKSGIRQLSGQSAAIEPDFVMPEGLICVNIADASKIAAKRYIKNHGVVVKTNKGHSGAGVLLFRPNDLPNDYRQCEKTVYEKLAKDKYWDMFPIVIEDYIEVNPNLGGGYPSIEYRIYKSGRIDFLYYCSLRVSSEGVFKGIEVGNDVLPERPAAQIVDTGFYIAERFAASGYRGYFDIDYVAAKNGKIYVTEANVRRTGGTHVYHLAKQFFGEDFLYQTFILSHNSYPLTRQWDFSELLERLQPVLFDKRNKEGVVIASQNSLANNQLAYVVFGKHKKRASDIEAHMESLLV